MVEEGSADFVVALEAAVLLVNKRIIQPPGSIT
jgi:hypothetical protein